MSNAVLIGFNAAGNLIRVRNRLGTDLSAAEPITPAELAAIRTTLQASASEVTLGLINVIDYGATGDGTTDDTEAIQAAIAAAQAGSIKELLFPPGDYKVSNITFPTGLTLEFVRGAKLQVDADATAVINASVNAGEYQIFTGAGTVQVGTGMTRPRPHWWAIGGAALMTFLSGSELVAGDNYMGTVWVPDMGSITWDVTPIARATLISPANIESNLAAAWVEWDAENSQFVLHVNMIAPVTLTSDLKFYMEVINATTE